VKAREQIRDLETRSLRYWNEDGIPELVLGGLFVILGLLDRTLHISKPPLFGGMVLGAVIEGVFSWTATQLKLRLSVPRTGYNDVRQPLVIRVAAGLIAVALIFAFGRLAPGGSVKALVYSVVVVPMISVLWLGERNLRFLVPAAGLVALSISLLPKWWIVGVGAAAIAHGAFRLRRYLKANPR